MALGGVRKCVVSYRRVGERVMKQSIIAFEQDEVGDWRAILACGHRQHVRHNPPLVTRPWVKTAEGRAQFLGYKLVCKLCAEQHDSPPTI